MVFGIQPFLQWCKLLQSKLVIEDPRRKLFLKRLALGVLFVVASLSVFYTRAGAPTRVYAATSSTLNFQARLLNANGGIVADGTYSVQFNLYSGLTGGTSQWNETQSVQVRSGYLSVYLGSNNPFPTTIDWSQDEYLTMNVNGDGEMSPRLHLTAVPYAFRAGQADKLTITGGAITGDNLAQLAPGALQSVNSTVAGLRINQTGSGGLLQLAAAGLDKFTIDNGGNGAFAGSLTVSGGSISVGTASQAGSLALQNGIGGLSQVSAGTSGLQLLSSGNVGVGVSDTTATLFVLDTKTNSGDPAGVNGGMYYNAAANKFRCYQGGQWQDCINGSNYNATASFVSGLANVAGTVTGANVETLVFTSATAVSNTAGATGFVAPAAGSFRTCLVKNNAAITAGTLNLRWRVNGVSVGSGACTMSAANNRSATSSLDPGVVSFNAGDTIGIAFDTVGMVPNGTDDFTVYWTVEYNSTTVGSGGSGASTLQAAYDNSNPNELTLNSTQGGLTILDASTPIGSNLFEVKNNTGSTTYFAVTASGVTSSAINLTSSGITNAGAISGLTTLSSSGDLGLSAGSGTINLDASTLRRTAVGATTIDLNDTSTTTLTLTNSDLSAVANLVVEGTVTATGFSGDGSGLTSLNASNITTGTLSDSVLSSNVALLDGGQTFSARPTFSSGLTLGNTSAAISGTIRWTGVDFEGYDGTSWVSLTSGTGTGGGGGGSPSNAFVQNGNAFGTAALLGTTDSNELRLITDGFNRLSIGATGDVTIANALSVNSDIFAGGNITGLSALTVGSGGSGALTLSSASGTLVLDANTLRRNAVGTTALELNDIADTTFTISNPDSSAVANLVVEGAITATSFSGDGSGLTSLNASNITSGTLSDGRLSSNVALLNVTNTYSAEQNFSGGLVLGSGTATAGSLRWTGTDFEGYDGTSWVSLTTPKQVIIQTYDSTGGTDLNTATPTAVPWDAETRKDAGTTHSNTTNNSRVYLDAAGWYKIAYSVTGANQTNSRNTVFCQVRMNGSTYNAPSGSYSYSRTTVDTYNTNSATVLVQTTAANEYYEVMCSQSGSAGADLAVANRSWTIAEMTTGAGSVTGGGSGGLAFENGGNAFGSTAVFGTTDNYGLNFITGGVTALSISAAGDATFANTLTVNNTLSVSAGGASIAGGIDNNGGGIVNTGALSGVSSLSSSGPLTLSSGGTGDLILDAASGKLVIGGTSTSLQRVAAGSFTIDLNDGADTTLVLSNNGGAAENLNLFDGSLQVSGVTVLTNGRVLQNVTADASILTTGTIGAGQGGTGLDGSLAGNGQLLIGNGSGFSLASLTDNGGITVTPGVGALGIAVSYGSAANTAVQGNVGLTCASGTGNLSGGGTSITLGLGGSCGAITIIDNPTFATSVTSPLFTGSGAVTLSSGGTGNLTLDSASNKLVIAGTDTTVERTGTGGLSFDLRDGSTTTLTLMNSAAGVADLNLADGSLLVAGTSILSSSAALSNLTGYAQNSGNFSQSGTGTFATGTGSVGLNGATTISTNTSGAVGLKINGTTGATAATAVSVDQTGDASNLVMTNTALTNGSLISMTQSNSTFTGTGLLFNFAAGSGSFTSGNFLDFQVNGASKLRIDSTGALISNSTSTTALDINNAGGLGYLTVDTSSAVGLVAIGSSTSDATAILLVLDSYNGASDPSGSNGSQYYSSARNVARCNEGIRGWTDCIGMSRPNTRRATNFDATGTTTAFTGYGDVITGTATTTTAIAATTNVSPMIQYATSGANNNVASVVTNANYNSSANPTYQAQVVIPATGSLASERIWAGLTSQTAAVMGASANPAGSYAAFRYDTSAGDTSWMCITKDGTTQHIPQTSGINPVLGTAYKLEVTVVPGSAAEFKINGTVVCGGSLTTQLPAANTLMRAAETITALQAAVKQIQVGWMYIEADR